MSTSKFEVEMFDGKNDFCLWQAKMLVHLRNLRLDEARKGESKMEDSIQNKVEILRRQETPLS